MAAAGLCMASLSTKVAASTSRSILGGFSCISLGASKKLDMYTYIHMYRYTHRDIYIYMYV